MKSRIKLHDTHNSGLDRTAPACDCMFSWFVQDLVNYNQLWRKLRNDTRVSGKVIQLLKFWYNEQSNCVRWAGSFSEEYKLAGGVSQGNLSSPRLFNLYMNKLIEKLSETGISCHVSGVCINNISYADDTVLLSPSISAMMRLLRICEKYAEAHRIRYNATKSEMMAFKAG